MTKRVSHSYFVVAIDYGRRGIEAVVKTEVTRREVIDRIKSGEYQNIVFIHAIDGLFIEDVTDEFLHCAKWGDHVREDA